jgi:hypothetical protein
MSLKFVNDIRRRVYGHRARWTARKLAQFIKPTDRVLDVGAGDCRLALLLKKKIGCEVFPSMSRISTRRICPWRFLTAKHCHFPMTALMSCC